MVQVARWSFAHRGPPRRSGGSGASRWVEEVIFAFHQPIVGGLLRAMAMLTGVGLLVDRGREAWTRARTATA